MERDNDKYNYFTPKDNIIIIDGDEVLFTGSTYWVKCDMSVGKQSSSHSVDTLFRRPKKTNEVDPREQCLKQELERIIKEQETAMADLNSAKSKGANEKPPLGPTPYMIWVENRIAELSDAINENVKAGRYEKIIEWSQQLISTVNMRDDL